MEQNKSNLGNIVSTSQTHIYISNSHYALKEHHKDLSKEKAALFVSANAGGKIFLIERVYQRKLTPEEITAEQEYLDELLNLQFERYGIPSYEIETVAFSDSQHLPDSLSYKYSELIRK